MNFTVELKKNSQYIVIFLFYINNIILINHKCKMKREC